MRALTAVILLWAQFALPAGQVLCRQQMAVGRIGCAMDMATMGAGPMGDAHGPGGGATRSADRTSNTAPPATPVSCAFSGLCVAAAPALLAARGGLVIPDSATVANYTAPPAPWVSQVAAPPFHPPIA